MKILVSAGKVPDTQSLSSGWFHAFQFLGHQTRSWVCGKDSSFDAMDEFDPDLVWAHSRDLTRDAVRAILDKKIKIILFISNFEEASEEEKNFVYQLRNAGVLLNTTFPTLISKERLHWGHHSGVYGILPCLPAADLVLPAPSPLQSSFRSEISFIGCYEARKEKNISEFIYPLLERYQVKLFGYGPWPTANYLGSLDKRSFQEVVENSKINISVSNDNSTSPSERIFKILKYNKTPVVHESLPDYHDIFGESCLFFKNVEELEEIIVKQPKLELTGIEWLINNHHCYTDRVQEIFKVLGVK
jgi:hypothetical protein